MRLFLLAVSLFAATETLGAADFTYNDLVQLIQSKKLTRLEDVLALMPKSLRSGYTLVYKSRSLQPASFAKPRVILFGETGTLTCAFNGDEQALGFDTLECFQFMPSERRFDFRQIQFPTASNGEKQVVFSQPNQSVNGKVSCSTCHSDDSRPNWDGYRNWVGIYGSFDDDFERTLDPNIDEKSNYASFVSSRAQDPRYKWLIQDTAAAAPYEQDDDSGELDHRPNLRFINMVTRMNATRAARIMESQLPSWKTMAFTISALQCYLTADQVAVLKKAGFDPGVGLDIARIFPDLGLQRQDWTTQIFDDPPFFDEPAYDLQTGYGVFSSQVAMAVIQQMARTTQDKVLLDGLAKVTQEVESGGYENSFFQALNAISPDVQYRGGTSAKEFVCPRALEIFVQDYLQRAKNQRTARLQ